MIDLKILEDGERKLEADLKKLISKSELSPADYDAFKKAMCILGMIENYPGGMMDEEGMSYGYPMSRNAAPYRGYSMNSMGHDSYGRMRSPVTGRYISNGVNDGTYANGYSGHSVNDRMIMALEQSIQPDMNEYERQKVEEEIRRLRRG
jgi:hypothetical protein